MQVTSPALAISGRRSLLLGLAGAALASVGPLRRGAHAAADLPLLQVWRDRSCECCGAWVAHMQGAGFPVAVNETDDMAAVKERHGIPSALQSCHTGLVSDYVIEGHVPAADVIRLLVERPDAKGLTIPGMPASAPGMDIPGHPYRVLLFGTSTGERTYAQHG